MRSVTLLDTATASTNLGDQIIMEAVRREIDEVCADAFQYSVDLNQSWDDNATADEVLFPSDDARTIEGLTEREVVALLCRDETCPEWIDLRVEVVGAGVTIFRLTCCGRYTADPGRMYYSSRGLGPFGVKSPVLPPRFREGERFSLKAV